MNIDFFEDLVTNISNEVTKQKEYIKTKSGMSNVSYIFERDNIKYIIRIPGKGTNEIINRANEYNTYIKIKDIGVCDKIEYFSSESGIKISRYIEKVRNCDPKNIEDVKLCIKKLKEFHDCRILVDYEFDLYERIAFYENKVQKQSLFRIYDNYQETKNKINRLKGFIDSFEIEKILCHIDPVCDNFLISSNNRDVYLIDWEYAAMQDKHLDIAMFCIYSNYTKKEIDNVIDMYFNGMCEESIRYKIYAYIAIGGFLWSIWSAYKIENGLELSEYAKTQYKYAVDYSKMVEDYLGV